jgi:hypothetical protein
MKNVTVVIGAGAIGQAIARRVSAGKHVLLADLRQENADAPSSTRVLPHGAPHRAIHELRRTVHRGLRRAPRAAGRVLEIPERAAIRRPREARERSSRLPVSRRRRAASSPAPMRLPLRSRRSPISRRRSTPTGTARHRSLSTRIPPRGNADAHRFASCEVRSNLVSSAVCHPWATPRADNRPSTSCSGVEGVEASCAYLREGLAACAVRSCRAA